MDNQAGRGDSGRHDTKQVVLGCLTTLVAWVGLSATFRPSDISTSSFLLVACGAALVHLATATTMGGKQNFVGSRTYHSSQLWVGGLAGFVAAVVIARFIPTDVSLIGAALSAFAGSLMLAASQEFSARSATTVTQRAAIIGTGEEAAEWIALLSDHPEVGVELVGCIGDPEWAVRSGLADSWLGPTNDLVSILDTHEIDLPILAVTSFRRPALAAIVSELRDAKHDVAMSWGVARLSSGRLSSRVLSHETIPVVRAHRPRASFLRAKRAMDITLAGLLLTLTSPFIFLAAIAVRLETKGPSFFRQRRVGLNSQAFEMIKLRSMVRDAEQVVDDLKDHNERTGPLFKMTGDPRVTRVGKILRATSIDELPQLINVIRGDMSLVGPRPALVEEVENFDPELANRAAVRPGITGLWQVEARGNESFQAYRRLDLHYVENWSLMFDLRIMLATAQMLVLGPMVAPFAKLFGAAQTSTSTETVEVTETAAVEPAKTALSFAATDPQRIAVLGAGYVGLTQALCLNFLGHDVVCADINEARIAELQAGLPPILEEGLEELLDAGNASGRLTFTADPVAAVDNADYIFLCVATPQGDDGSADLSYLTAAARQIGPAVKPGAVVINKSTVPVGSSLLVSGELGRTDVAVVSNPEFLREGTAIADWLKPDRIVVGGEAEAAGKVMGLYSQLPGTRIICDAPSAELLKYASNAYLATRLTFVNSISEVCDRVGANVHEVTRGMGLDGRIGPRYLEPGPGWGGSCLPKDTHALAYQAEAAGADFRQLRSTIEANELHLDRAANMILQAVEGCDQPTVGVLGMAFKAGTGDTRESPAVKIMQRLVAAGVTVRAFDPAVVEAPIEGIEVATSSDIVAKGADALAVLTEWPEFGELEFDKIGDLMNKRVVVDLRSMLDGAELAGHGFSYHEIGGVPQAPQAHAL